MRKNEYRVWFTNGNYIPECEEVYALNQDEAVILAKAERIKAGRDHTMYSVEELYLAPDDL